MFKIYKGQNLKPIHEDVNWEDSTAEVVRFSKKQNKWYIVEDGNIERWCDENTILKEYIELDIK